MVTCSSLTAQQPYMACMPQSRPRVRIVFIKAFFLHKAAHKQRVIHISRFVKGRDQLQSQNFLAQCSPFTFKIVFWQILYHNWSPE